LVLGSLVASEPSSHATDLPKPIVVNLDLKSRAIDIDLGTVAGDVQTEHRVVLRNSTGTSIRIVEIKPECGCVIAFGGIGELPAGGETFFDFKLPSSRFAGAASKTIAVAFEGGHQIGLRLISKVAADVICSAEVITFETQRNSSSITVDAVGDDVTIESVSVVGGSVRTSQMSANPSSIQLTLQKSSDAESLTDLVRVQYLKKSRMVVRDFPIQIRNVVEYRLVPRELVMAYSVSGNSYLGSVRIAGREDLSWIEPSCIKLCDAEGVSFVHEQPSIDVQFNSDRVAKLTLELKDVGCFSNESYCLHVFKGTDVVLICPIRVSNR